VKILDIVNDADKSQTEFLLKLALRGEIIDREVPINASNGQTYWFRIKVFPIKNPTNQIIGVTILSLDVSEKGNLSFLFKKVKSGLKISSKIRLSHWLCSIKTSK
jgi:hypothetical protein